MARQVPPYFDFLIEGFHRGRVQRFVHLGHWDQPVAGNQPPRPGEFETAQERLNALLLDLADLAPGQRVLDVGCGFGGSLEKINQGFGGMLLAGANIDPRQIELCQRLPARNGNRFQWIHTDACRLPFRDQSFDRLLCIEAMFHFPSRRLFMQEAARVLRPGGVLVVSDIVLVGSARGEEQASFIEDALRAGFGPWPDIWSVDADHRELADAAGMVCSRLIDATINTLPSHRFTVPPRLEPWDAPPDPSLRAGLVLKWLHERGLLRYLYSRFDKPCDEGVVGRSRRERL
ncbi:class I SAM-dependent methyltransferase [Verrucomicrobiota bacterium sgz303538]